MSSQPPIVLSSLDLERLERLLDSTSYKQVPGMDALRRELDRATVVHPTEMPPNVVTMNSTVRFVDEATGSNYELSLVYPNSAGSPETVSIMAPIGSALLGLSVNQSISWQVPGGRELRLRILEIVQQPEASMKYHR